MKASMDAHARHAAGMLMEASRVRMAEAGGQIQREGNGWREELATCPPPGNPSAPAALLCTWWLAHCR